MNDSKKNLIDYPEDFYFFDSVKIAEHANSMNTEIAQLHFFESLKMEFDNGSSFCKHHIKRIINSRAYHEKYTLPLPEHLSAKTKDEYDDLENFIKRRFSSNPENSWTFFFGSSEDYIFITNNLSLFFTGKIYNPTHKISIKPATRSKFYEAIHDIYYHCSPFKNLSRDKKFISLIKNIDCFSKSTNSEIYNKLIHY